MEAIVQLYNQYKDEKTCLLNIDLLDNLPDSVEVVTTSVKFNLKKLDMHFSCVGSKNNQDIWFPGKSICMQIAKAIGLSITSIRTEPVIELIDSNIFLGKSLEDEPVYHKRKTSITAYAKGSIKEIDYTDRQVSDSATFNFWNRAESEFLKPKNNKLYDTILKRKQRLNELEKFAESQAISRALGRLVRQAAGMQTGYTKEELSTGFFIFQKYVRSKNMLKLKDAAEIDAIRKGVKNNENKLLSNENYIEPEPEPEPEQKQEQLTLTETEYEKIVRLLEKYIYSELKNKEVYDYLNSINAIDIVTKAISEKQPITILKKYLNLIEQRLTEQNLHFLESEDIF